MHVPAPTKPPAPHRTAAGPKQVGNDVQPDGYVPVICGLSRTKFADLERAWDAVRHAKRPRVHTFIATSQIHMEHKLRMTPDQVGGVCSEGGV